MTADLAARLHQHRAGDIRGFSGRYGVTRLVRFEMYGDMPGAIAREEQLKRWRREWKLNLIEGDNPHRIDLATGLGLACGGGDGRTVDAETSSA